MFFIKWLLTVLFQPYLSVLFDICILLYSDSPIVICLQLILLGNILTYVLESGLYCSAEELALAFPTAFPLLSVPLASNFATHIPVNSLFPNLKPGCTILGVVAPSLNLLSS